MLTKDDRQMIYKRCVEQWGLPSQLQIAAEEAAELCVALHHLARGAPLSDVIDEIADVEIMIEQLKYTYALGNLNLTIIKEKKLEHVLELLDKGGGGDEEMPPPCKDCIRVYGSPSCLDAQKGTYNYSCKFPRLLAGGKCGYKGFCCDKGEDGECNAAADAVCISRKTGGD